MITPACFHLEIRTIFLWILFLYEAMVSVVIHFYSKCPKIANILFHTFELKFAFYGVIS